MAWETCPACKGEGVTGYTGAEGLTPVFCRRCGGTGVIEVPAPETVECPACGGHGAVFPTATVGMWAGLVPFEAAPEKCDLCNGTGEVDPATANEYEADRMAEEWV